MTDLSNDGAPGRGHNSGIDFAKEMTAELGRDFAGMFADAQALLDEGRALLEDEAAGGRIIADDDEERAGKFAAFYKRTGGHATALIAQHDASKLPHKTKADTIDTVFFGWVDKLKRRDKKAKPGIADIVYACFDDWNQRKLKREEVKRARAALDARIEADRLLAEAEDALRTEQAAIAAADRARAPEQITKKNEIAIEAGAVADEAKVDALIAGDKADAAELLTKAKPADIVRTRFDEGGAMGTMQTEKFAEITDNKVLDMAALWPHVSLANRQLALNLYATSVNHSEEPSVQIAGAKFGRRPKTRIK